MLDFEENSKKLRNMQIKLQEIGESLWHFKLNKWIIRTRR